MALRVSGRLQGANPCFFFFFFLTFGVKRMLIRVLSTHPALAFRMATPLSHSPLLKSPSYLLLQHRSFAPPSLSRFISFRSFSSPLSTPFSSLSSNRSSKKWKQPIAVLLEIGGVKIAKDGSYFSFLLLSKDRIFVSLVRYLVQKDIFLKPLIWFLGFALRFLGGGMGPFKTPHFHGMFDKNYSACE